MRDEELILSKTKKKDRKNERKCGKKNGKKHAFTHVEQFYQNVYFVFQPMHANKGNANEYGRKIVLFFICFESEKTTFGHGNLWFVIVAALNTHS